MAERKKKREYQRAFRPKPGTVSGSLFINAIPGPMYRRFRNRVGRDGRSMRSVVLSLIQEWLNHERSGEVDDGDRSGETYVDFEGHPLQAGTGEKAEGGEADRQPGHAVSPGVDRRMDGGEHHHPDGGESVDRTVQALLIVQAELMTRIERLEEKAGDAAQS